MADKAAVVEPKTIILKMWLLFLCFIVLATTFTAGLWPFSFKKANEVRWRPDEQGLYLGDYGMLMSGGTFSGIPPKDGGGYSIEIWMEPGLTWDSNTILTFYEPRHLPTFVVRQSGDDLSFSRTFASRHEQTQQKSLFVDHVFRKGQKVLITFSSTPGTLRVYLNGVLKKKSGNLEITGNDFQGTLVVGNSPYGNSSLMATFRGLALYDRALRADEVVENYMKWQESRELLAAKDSLPYTLYLFNEREGSVVRNVGRVGPDLVIPKHYFIFEHTFLEPFWSEYQTTWAYVKDLAINILGLVPLGLCFSALFAWLLGTRQALLWVTIFGLCVSLTIEILQAFMPTRLSGTTDLITNTLGTAIGGYVYLSGFLQSCLRRWGMIQTKTKDSV